MSTNPAADKPVTSNIPVLAGYNSGFGGTASTDLNLRTNGESLVTEHWVKKVALTVLENILKRERDSDTLSLAYSLTYSLAYSLMLGLPGLPGLPGLLLVESEKDRLLLNE